MHLRLKKIIGVALSIFLLFAQAGNALAIFSPVLSKEVGDIKKHILTARQQNGVGSWLNAMEKVRKNNAEWANDGKASGIPGLFVSYWVPLQAIFAQAFSESFLDGFLMLIYQDPETNGSITACLRDDIWQMQALQEEVLNELFKSSLFNDSVNSAILWSDYKRLEGRLAGNNDDYKMSSLKRDWASTIVWFPDGGINYYEDCPFGDLNEAIDSARTSIERFTSGDTYFQMGSMKMATLWAVAEKRAVKRAADYIAKNQISLSLGGSPGADPEGLVSKNFGGDFLTAVKRAKEAYDSFHAGELIGSIGESAEKEAAAFAKMFENKGSSREVLAEYANTLKARQQDLARISNSLKFNLQLSRVSEQSLISIEAMMLAINDVIKQATSQKVLPKLCERLSLIPKKQCPNKASNEPVVCD